MERRATTHWPWSIVHVGTKVMNFMKHKLYCCVSFTYDNYNSPTVRFDKGLSFMYLKTTFCWPAVSLEQNNGTPCLVIVGMMSIVPYDLNSQFYLFHCFVFSFSSEHMLPVEISKVDRVTGMFKGNVEMLTGKPKSNDYIIIQRMKKLRFLSLKHMTIATWMMSLKLTVSFCQISSNALQKLRLKQEIPYVITPRADWPLQVSNTKFMPFCKN